MSGLEIHPRFATKTQVPGVYHRRLDEIVVTAISDGYVLGSMSVLRNIGVKEATTILVAACRPIPRQTSVNCYLVRFDNRVILIDAGCGYSGRPSAGHMIDNMGTAGVAPEQVDTILMTHLHPDHAGGLLNERGQVAFPNAELRIHEAELAYWQSEDAAALAKRTGQGVICFDAARRVVNTYASRVATFKSGPVDTFVTAVHLPGHTPGHCGFRITSVGEELLVWGDIIHIPEIQVAIPDVTLQLDVDPPLAAATRKALFDEVSKSKPVIAGMHLHFPGFVRPMQDGGFRLQPEPWRHDP